MRFADLLLAPLALASTLAWAEGGKGRADDYGKPVSFTCPVGGEKFRQVIDTMGYPLEFWPDGGNPGSEWSDVELPECPSNGLVLMTRYQHEEGDSQEPYSAAEIARLPALIASPEYRAQLKDSRATRLLWLAERLGRPAAQRYHLLQRAAWVAKTPEDRKRWMARIASESDALIASPGFPPAFAAQVEVFAVNALRETGQWEAALSRIGALAARQAARFATKPRNPHVFDPSQDGSHYLHRMRAVILEKDDDPHPIGMMGERWASAVCRDLREVGARSKPAANTARGCARRKAEKDAEDAKYALLEELESNVAKREKLCRDTPIASRSVLETTTCDYLAQQLEDESSRARQQDEAQRLLADPVTLDAECKAVKISRDDTPASALGEACQKRRAALNEAETARLIELMEKTPAEYDRRCHYPYPQMTSEDPLEEACATIKSAREFEKFDKAAQQMSAKGSRP